MRDSCFYPIGSAGLAWGPAELAQWRARQRSYADDVLSPIARLDFVCPP